MLDELFFREKLKKHKFDYIFFGFFVTIVGFTFTILFFGLDSSAAQILTIALLLTPPIVKLLRQEEVLVRRNGVKHLYNNHKNIFEIYLFIFIGVFVGFLLTQLIVVNFAEPDSFSTIFSFQTNYINSDQELSYDLLDRFTGKNLSADNPVVSLLIKGLVVVALAFLLSLFYGSGGIFFIVASASIFSTLILYALNSGAFWEYSVFFLVIFFLFLLPVILSSIAGGVLSRAFVHEKIRSKHMKKVLKDATSLFVISLAGIIVLTCVWVIACYFLRFVVF